MNDTTTPLPIASLILDRANDLMIGPKEIVLKCGYKNLSKGLRRFQELLKGDMDSSKCILEKLPMVLNLDSDILERAVKESLSQIQGQVEASYRESFKPHAIIVCERTIPEPIWLAAIIGIDRLIRIEFAEGSAPITFIEQALIGLSQKLGRWNSSVLPCFGRLKSIIVNYSCDRAVEFDLEGKPLRVVDKAIRVGVSTIALSGRPIKPIELDPLFGR
jgi:hypothetical protein